MLNHQGWDIKISLCKGECKISSMKKTILLTLAAAMLGLAACGGQSSPAASSSSQASTSHPTGLSTDSSSQATSEAPKVFDGDISALEVGVAADVDGVIAQKLTKGFTLADGKGAVYVYQTTDLPVGTHVHVEGSTEKYYGVYEISKATVTKKEGGTRGLDDIVKDETVLTEAMVGTFFEEVTAAKAEGQDPYPVTKNIPYKLTGVTAVANGSYGGAFQLGQSKLLCPHYYVAANNRTEANRVYESVYAGVSYDVSFYLMGTNSSNNIDIHIYDLKANYAAVESVNLVETAEVEVGSTLKLNASVLPAGADQALEWSTSDAETATVDNGTIAGLKEGTVTITAKSVADPTKSASCAVTVKAATIEYESIGALSFNKDENVVIDNKLDDAEDKYISYAENGVTIEVRKGTSSNDVNVWQATYSSCRWYVGHAVTFVSAQDIAKIELSCDSGYATMKNDQSVIEGATYAYDGNKMIITLDTAAKTFSFSPDKQLRPNKVELFKVK